MATANSLGLGMLTAVVVALFTIGIFIFVFVIAGSELESTLEANQATDGAGTEGDFNLTNTTAATLTNCDNAFGGTNARGATVTNNTDGATVPAAQYNITNCGITAEFDAAYADQLVNITYTYTFTDNPETLEIVNSSKSALSDVPNWFPTFIVLAAVVVLIAMIALVIVGIRGTGFSGSGGGAA